MGNSKISVVTENQKMTDNWDKIKHVHVFMVQEKHFFNAKW